MNGGKALEVAVAGGVARGHCEAHRVHDYTISRTVSSYTRKLSANVIRHSGSAYGFLIY